MSLCEHTYTCVFKRERMRGRARKSERGGPGEVRERDREGREREE